MTTLKQNNRIHRSRIGSDATNALTVLLKTRGCSYAKSKNPCKFCAFHKFAEKNPNELGPERLRTKVETAVVGYHFGKESIGELWILNGGSMFADAEVRPLERKAIFEALAPLGLLRLLVEARPEHISSKKIQEAKLILPQTELEIGIGLETADEDLRARLNKGFTKKDFEKATHILSEEGVSLGAYLLFKPIPMSEEEATKDLALSMQYLSELQRRLCMRIRVFLLPFIAYEGMKIEPNHHPSKLSSLLRLVRNAPDNLEIFMFFGEVESAIKKGWESPYTAQGQQVMEILGCFNATGDRSLLEQFDLK